MGMRESMGADIHRRVGQRRFFFDSDGPLVDRKGAAFRIFAIRHNQLGKAPTFLQTFSGGTLSDAKSGSIT